MREINSIFPDFRLTSLSPNHRREHSDYKINHRCRRSFIKFAPIRVASRFRDLFARNRIFAFKRRLIRFNHTEFCYR